MQAHKEAGQAGTRGAALHRPSAARPGTLGVPLHWSLPVDRRAVCFRLAPESAREPGARWSHPVEPESLHPACRHIALPAPPAGTGAGAGGDASGGAGGGAGAEGSAAEGAGGEPGAGGARYLRGVAALQTAAAPALELRGAHGGAPRRERRLSGCARRAWPRLRHVMCSDTNTV